MTRYERAVEAGVLREQGLTGIAIAERLGISRSYAYALLNDPDGSGDKKRREKYRGTCIDCGARTDGSGGYDAPKRCIRCHNISTRIWTEATIVAAIRRFAKRYGRPPHAPDFDTNAARRLGHDWRATRFHEDGDYPHPTTVLERFGTWNAAITAADFPPLGVGKYNRTGSAPGAKQRAVHLKAERTDRAV